MNTTAEIRTLFQMLRGQIRSGSHAERLDAFYAPQAHSYDAFRERLLHGRNSLINILKPDPGSHVVELGAGTGRNIEVFGDRIATFAQLDLVDVCKPLLEQARQRAARWPKVVNVVEADVERFRPAHAVDCVYLSYSLSMTANWKKTLNNAVRMLEQGTAAMESIDTAMKGGCNFPMGPFALLDLVGLDTSLAILDALYNEFRDPNYAAMPTLRRMVAAGHLGRKSKRGFYTY